MYVQAISWQSNNIILAAISPVFLQRFLFVTGSVRHFIWILILLSLKSEAKLWLGSVGEDKTVTMGCDRILQKVTSSYELCGCHWFGSKMRSGCFIICNQGSMSMQVTEILAEIICTNAYTIMFIFRLLNCPPLLKEVNKRSLHFWLKHWRGPKVGNSLFFFSKLEISTKPTITKKIQPWP